MGIPDEIDRLKALEFADELKSTIEQMIAEIESDYTTITTQRDGASVIVEAKDKDIATAKMEIARLKGENYDMSSKLGFKSPEDKQENDRPSGVAGLFTKRNRKEIP